MKMNAQRPPIKYSLKTREDGNNHYWDTSFQLRPTFKGNSFGQYKVTINEAMFQNTEPLIMKDDYYQFEIYTTAAGNKKYKYVWKTVMRKDFYLYRQGGAEWKLVSQMLTGTLKNLDGESYKYTYQQTFRTRYESTYADSQWSDWKLDETYAASDTSFNMSVNIVDEDYNNYNGRNAGVYPIMYFDISNIVLLEGTFDSIRMTYSWGYCYILNNTNLYSYPITDNNMKPKNSNPAFDYTGHYYFEFCNIRIGGPYLYILDVPTVKVDVMTMNEANQGFNIVGHVTNTANNHNENVQFISSMEGKVNALSNFRIRLLNDNFEPVKIRSPLTILLTVSGDDE